TVLNAVWVGSPDPQVSGRPELTAVSSEPIASCGFACGLLAGRGRSHSCPSLQSCRKHRPCRRLSQGGPLSPSSGSCCSMAHAPDPDEAGGPERDCALCAPFLDLEQKVLQALRESGAPVKAAQLARSCQVPKKRLNQVLYRMKDSKVTLLGSATWCLAADGPGGPGPSAQTQPSPGKKVEPQEADSAAQPHGAEASGQGVKPEKKIYGFLDARGSHRALHIAQALGMKTAKDVNRDLYALKSLHVLDLDSNSKMWGIYRPEQPGGTNQTTTIIVQKNPINMISQNAPESEIYIQSCADLQIGHGNLIVKQKPAVGSGAVAPLQLPTPPNPPAGIWGPQDIRVEKSELKQVQLGHANQMSVHSAGPEGPAHAPPGSPPGSATPAAPRAAFKIQTFQPGPQAEGVAAQRIHISSCSLESVSIGNSNRMTVSPAPAAPGGAAEPWDEERGAGELGEDFGERAPWGPPPEATPPRGPSPCDEDQAVPAQVSMSAALLGAMTLDSQVLGAAEDSHGEDTVQTRDAAARLSQAGGVPATENEAALVGTKRLPWFRQDETRRPPEHPFRASFNPLEQ
ncbi:Z-DNA-binding protein 1, partial [Galemys pyrenaicus]